jgi:hypothetical protein
MTFKLYEDIWVNNLIKYHPKLYWIYRMKYELKNIELVELYREDCILEINMIKNLVNGAEILERV